MASIKIPLMRSTFFREAETRERLAEFIRTSPRLSMGDQCKAFEKAFSVYQERKSSLLVSSGSAANLGLIQALLNLGRLQKGDRVGVSALTWATNVMPIMQLGLIPVAIDCDRSHLNVTAAELQKHIDSLKAVFLTNVLGFCGDIENIAALCEKKKVILLEDNCESLGTRYQGKLLGNFGLASTFSFFVGHHLSTIEGGMICTDDQELASMLLMVRAHGWDRNLTPEEQQALRTKHGLDDFHARYTFYEPAYNLRTTEISGFLGALQLPMLEATIEKRAKNFTRFHAAALRHPDRYYALTSDHIERLSNFAMPLVTTSADILRETVERFEEAGVEIRPIIAGDITTHPFWTKELPKTDCPNSRIIHSQGFYFANNPDLTDDEVTLMCGLL
ncbi:MAG: DegT/DnrJ/EryC1/StrS aminotransferase family protein [Candidatus Peribacteraceae bacterium]|nr:DegT/DnrJ/EryC1/StrS aminotransferase family protein [Candidatus Peribacteraceae bacterium]MBP9850999.1 DegT/DnrJ/EryC1/StrS aminotransferase family protein [Candidatus Peribacteraceae bacterium]